MIGVLMLLWFSERVASSSPINKKNTTQNAEARLISLISCCMRMLAERSCVAMFCHVFYVFSPVAVCQVSFNPTLRLVLAVQL